MSAVAQFFAPGTYKFTVRSTDEAVSLIREKLGPTARVLSVRNAAAPGLKKFFAAPRLEVIAQVDAEVSDVATFDETSDEPALPGQIDEPPAAARARLAPFPSTLGLTGLLRRTGISEAALQRLQAGPNWSELNALPLHRALAETASLLRSQVEGRTMRAPLSRAAFLGAAGVGRTTALCKWIARETFRRARTGHVVSVEFDRPNALGPLPVFSEVATE